MTATLVLPARERVAPAVAICIVAFAMAAGPARGNIAADMTRDLAVSGVPEAQVQVSAAADADEAEMNPEAPTMPVARVTINAPAPKPLAGILQSPGQGAFDYTTLPPSHIVWQLAVLEAAKHVIAAGTPLAGVTITTNVAGEPPATSPELMLGLADLTATSSPPTTMSIEDIRTEIRASLPPWAATGTVEVTTDAADERVVTLSLAVPWLLVATHDVRSLSNVLAKQQAVLTARGGNIGRAIVRITDTQTGDPLYVSADDVLLGTRSYWDSPLIAAFVGPGLLVGDPLGNLTGVDTTPAGNALPRP